jgi:large subunit ribosomal protein L13
MKTYMANNETVERRWFVVDAAGERLGRLSSEVAAVLRGKHKPTFTPHVDCGDNVIIVNAENIELTGNKWDNKKYYRHSRYPGGLKTTTAKVMNQTHPERLIEFAVKGMLPKGRLGRQMYTKLYVYSGPNHPHAAQKPEELKIKG